MQFKDSLVRIFLTLLDIWDNSGKSAAEEYKDCGPGGTGSGTWIPAFLPHGCRAMHCTRPGLHAMPLCVAQFVSHVTRSTGPRIRQMAVVGLNELTYVNHLVQASGATILFACLPVIFWGYYALNLYEENMIMYYINRRILFPFYLC